MEKIEVERDRRVTIAEIAELRKSVNWSTNPDKYRKAMKHTYAHFSMRQNGKLIAFARIVSDCSIHSFIVDVTVRKGFRNKGLGRKLLKYMVKEMKKEGMKYVELTFNPKLGSFYKKCGFNIIKAGHIKFKD